MAAIGAGVATGQASTPKLEVHLLGVPGPSQVTYGQTVAHRSTAINHGRKTFRNVTFHEPIPFTVSNGQTLKATLAYASCSAVVTASEVSCQLGKLRGGQAAAVTIVWRVPGAGSSPGCSGCLLSQAFWSASERDDDDDGGENDHNGQESFATETIATGLLSAADPNRAAVYALAPCSNPAHPTVATNPKVDDDHNPVATSVCAPQVNGSALDPGLVAEVAERDTPGGPGATQSSAICMPKSGSACTNGTTTDPFQFSTPARFTFTIALDDDHDRITKVFRDGHLVPPCPGDPCVQSIGFDRKTEIWTVVALSKSNGIWDFG